MRFPSKVPRARSVSVCQIAHSLSSISSCTRLGSLVCCKASLPSKVPDSVPTNTRHCNESEQEESLGSTSDHTGGTHSNRWLAYYLLPKTILSPQWRGPASRHFWAYVAHLGVSGTMEQIDRFCEQIPPGYFPNAQYFVLNHALLGALRSRHWSRISVLINWMKASQVSILPRALRQLLDLVVPSLLLIAVKFLSEWNHVEIVETAVILHAANIGAGEELESLLKTVTGPRINDITMAHVHVNLPQLADQPLVKESIMPCFNCQVCGNVGPPGSRQCVFCTIVPNQTKWQCHNCQFYSPTSTDQCLVCCEPLDQQCVVQTDSEWRCVACRDHNNSRFSPCGTCGSPHSDYLQHSTPCEECGAENCFTLHGPFCWKCGSLHSSVEARPFLWGCRECRQLNPWVYSQCCSCNATPGPTTLLLPYFQNMCTTCGSSFPAWETRCTCCKSTQPMKESNSICGSCHSALLPGGSVCLSCCGAAEAETRSTWVCVVNGCFAINSSDRVSCSSCGNAYTPNFAMNEHDEALLSIDVSPKVKFIDMGSRSPHDSSTLQDWASCSGFSTPSPLSNWLILKSLCIILAKKQFLSTATLQCCCSLVQSLVTSPYILPWQTADILVQESISNPYIPILVSGEVHSAIGIIRYLLRRIAELHAQHEVISHKQQVFTFALKLIDAVGNSTEFDEIGFDVLSDLCRLARPADEARIITETRLEYLVKAKLSRYDILQGSLCEECLGLPHDGSCYQ